MEKIDKRVYDDYLDSQLDELWEMAQYIHANPEIAFEEYKTSKVQVDYLEKQGFEVDYNIGTLPTAFKAKFSNGEGELSLAVVSEYDALPEIGHACGHNLISTTALGTAITTKKYMEDNNIQGDLYVIGTPAEETGGGKIILLENGIFDGIDTVLMMHPTSEPTRLAGECMSSMKIEIEFTGKSSHASSHPEKGANALSAANLYFVATGMMRQHFKGETRLSGIINEGGKATGMIPETVTVSGSISTFNLKTLEQYAEKVRQCAEGAALAMGCEVDFQLTPGYQGRIPNQTLSDVCRAEFEELDEPLLDGMPFDYGGEDLGNVSRVIPICNPYTTIFPDHKISNHTVQFRELANSQAGKHCLQVSSKAMARTMMELFENPEIVQQAKEELADRLVAEAKL